jgi:hypothetical protein
LCSLGVEGLEEDFKHLFFSCPFSDACWTFLGVHWDLSLDFQHMVLMARLNFNSVIFREVLIIGCWAIWCHRNDIIFDSATLSFSSWKSTFVRELSAVSPRAKPSVKNKLLLYLSSLP